MTPSDAADPYSPRAPYAHLRREGVAHCLVAIADVAADCAPELTRLYARAAGLFDTRPVDMAPFLEIARRLYDGPCVTERAASLRQVIRGRSGMVRGGDGAIAGEVWAMPTAAIGALLAQAPPPLGFGTVALEDGPCLGFLAEGTGVEGAEDITAFGGWRAWIAAN